MAPKEILKVSSSITAEAFAAQLHAIVDPDPTRFIAFKGNELAAENIRKNFESLGLQAEVQPMGLPESLTQYMGGRESLAGNVIGYLKGTDKADEVVIVGCHYDSVNWENISGPAPGVDDNGSGVALMLMLAKALAAHKPRRSVLFVSFQAEEEGLLGSKKFAQLFATGGDGPARFGKPVAAIVADEVAWPGRTQAERKVIFETKGRGKGTDAVVDTLAHASQQQCSGGFSDCVNGFVVNYHGFGSDHMTLLSAGVPTVLVIERDNLMYADKFGHTAEDTKANVHPAFGAHVSSVVAQALWDLANAP